MEEEPSVILFNSVKMQVIQLCTYKFLIFKFNFTKMYEIIDWKMEIWYERYCSYGGGVISSYLVFWPKMGLLSSP